MRLHDELLTLTALSYPVFYTVAVSCGALITWEEVDSWYSRLLHPDTCPRFTERETDAANHKELFFEIWGTLAFYMKWLRSLKGISPCVNHQVWMDFYPGHKSIRDYHGFKASFSVRQMWDVYGFRCCIIDKNILFTLASRIIVTTL